MMHTAQSFSNFNGEQWEYVCEKKECLIGINNYIQDKEGKKNPFLTTYVQIISASKKKLDLVDKENQTYKLGEEKLNVTQIFVTFPLNIDLRVKPLIRLGKKQISGFTFLYCNAKIGCKASLSMTTEVVELFKKEKEMAVIFRGFGSSKILEFKFPLKGFSKSYDKLLKT